MTQKEATALIMRGINLLRALPQSKDQLEADLGQEINDAIAFAGKVADARNHTVAEKIIDANAAGLRSFLAVANKLSTAHANSLPEFGIPSLLARHDYSPACNWLIGTLYTADGLKAGMKQA